MCRISGWDLERYRSCQRRSLSKSAGCIQTINREAEWLRRAKDKRISERKGSALQIYSVSDADARCPLYILCDKQGGVSVNFQLLPLRLLPVPCPLIPQQSFFHFVKCFLVIPGSLQPIISDYFKFFTRSIIISG